MSESRYPELEWREVSPYCWEREIDEAERFYTYLAKTFEGSGRMFFAITGFVSLSIDVRDSEDIAVTGQKLEDALRHGWVALRHDHPTIACETIYNVKRNKWIKSYPAFDTNATTERQEQWLRDTFVTIKSDISGQDWCNADPPAPKLPTLFVIHGPSKDDKDAARRDIVIRSPHEIMDGIGTLHLLNNLLKHTAHFLENGPNLSAANPGSEVGNLSPPLRVAAAIPPILTLAQQERLQNIISHNTSLRQNGEILTLPYNKSSVVPGKHQRIEIILEVEQTSSILEACKKMNATVTHIFHAAIAMTLRDLQNRATEARTSRYINYALVNERPKCITPYQSAKHAASVYHSVSGESLALDLQILGKDHKREPTKERDEFLVLVEQVQKHYHAIRDNTEGLALAPAFWSMGTPALDDSTSTPEETPIPPPNPSPSVSISSMGILDKIISPRHGLITAHQPWVTGEELGNGYGVFLGSWEGQLQLSMAYNDAFHEKEDAQAFLKDCLRHVVEHFGLPTTGSDDA